MTTRMTAKMTDAEKVTEHPVTAWFGGSFDPPHYGHLGVAEMALRSGCCDQVLWVPAYRPPHKPGRALAPFAERLRQIRELIAGRRDMAVSDLEDRLRLDPSYTIDVLSALRREVPGKLVLLIGADSLLELHTWHRAEELAEKYDIFTYPRAGATVSASKLAGRWPDRPDLAEKLLRHCLNGDFFHISSTEIRKRMEKSPTRWHIIADEDAAAAPTLAASKQPTTNQGEKFMSGQTRPSGIDYQELLAFCVKCAEDKKAENLLALDTSKLSSVADRMLIATAGSEPQLRALSSFLERQVRETFHKRVSNQPDDASSGWVLLDYGNLIIHLMTSEMRGRYNLEGLWSDAPAIELVSLLASGRRPDGE